MNGDPVSDDELRLRRLWESALPPTSLRQRYAAALAHGGTRAAPGEHRSLRPVLAAVLAASVVAAGGLAAARLGFDRGHGSAPPSGPVRTGAASPRPTPHPSAVPWAALPPGGIVGGATPPAVASPPIPVPPGTPACRSTQLDGVFLGSSAAGGNTNFLVGLRNRGSTACVLSGYATVAVLSSSGAVLAPSGGPEGHGTMFDDWPVVQVLMVPGTPAYPTAAPLPLQPSRGQAVMNMAWYDCSQPAAHTLRLDLPNGGGRLVVPFDVRAAMSPACVSAQYPLRTLAVGTLSPATFTWPPAPQTIQVRVRVSAPATVRRGSTLVYDVTVADDDSVPLLLQPCPSYVEYLGTKQAVGSYLLNCAPVQSIPAGGQVTFEMHLDVPGSMPLGPTLLAWTIEDERVAEPSDTASITVVG